MKYTMTAMVLACLLLQGCNKPEFRTARLTDSVRNGTQDEKKGVLFGDISVVDRFRPENPGTLILCINKEEDGPDTTVMKCESTVTVQPNDIKAGGKKQLLVETERRSFGIDGFLYSYPDKGNSMQTHTTKILLKNPIHHKLNDYGELAYIGDFAFTVVENQETETPEIRVAFNDGFAAMQKTMAEAKAAGKITANSKFNRMTNQQLTEFSQPQEMVYKSSSFTRQVQSTPMIYYVPRYK